MVTFELGENMSLTNREKNLLDKAKQRPILFDEDSPELTEDMEKAFVAARKAKPYRGEPITLYVSPATMEKVKHMGEDYRAILGKMLDKAVEEYPIRH